jgi:hypothetical protein
MAKPLGETALIEHFSTRPEPLRVKRTGVVVWAEEERYLDLRLSTVEGAAVAGQVVNDGDRLVYASLFATQIA